MKIRFPRDASHLTQTMGRPLSPYRTDENGWTDLHYAAALNLPDSARNLLAQGASVDAPLVSDGEQLDGLPLKVLRRYGFRFRTWEREGDLPLHLATWSSATPALGVLIDFGANVQAKVDTGWTALHVAARFNSVPAATLLAAHGADIAAKGPCMAGPRCTPLCATTRSRWRSSCWIKVRQWTRRSSTA